jgi:uncharacterized protein YuzE
MGGKMAKEAILEYDEENDILYIYTEKNPSDSVDFDNFVIDFSKDGMITGVEILNSSKFAPKQFLMKAKSAALSVIQQGREYAIVKIIVFAINQKKEIFVPSPVPQMIKV